MNGVMPNMPSPTMSTFSVGAPASSQQPVVSEAGVYTNGLPQSYPARESLLRCRGPTPFCLNETLGLLWILLTSIIFKCCLQ